VSPRARVYLNVALATIAAVGVVVGLTLDTRTNPMQPKPFAGKPPVPRGLTGPAGVAIEQVFRQWPHGAIGTMQKLGLEYPKSAIVQFYRGIAFLWAGYPTDAAQALEAAKKFGANSYVAEKADNILHPNYYAPSAPPYYPVFAPTERNALLQRGSVLQEEGHQLSAERLYQQAARRDPNDPQAQVAAAVGLFDEDNLNVSFGRLGPLTARFPRSQSVHYYLGYLLAWTDQRTDAITQYEDTVRLGPSTTLGRAATQWLEALAKAAGPLSRG
jgi:tetratricopeptide (TPR) repeat protein